MNEECENCPHKGQCDMQCYNEYSVWWTLSAQYEEEDP